MTTSVAVGDTPTKLAITDGSRRPAVQNLGPDTVYLTTNSSAGAADGLRLEPDMSFEPTEPLATWAPRGLWAQTDGAGDADVRHT